MEKAHPNKQLHQTRGSRNSSQLFTFKRGPICFAGRSRSSRTSGRPGMAWVTEIWVTWWLGNSAKPGLVGCDRQVLFGVPQVCLFSWQVATAMREVAGADGKNAWIFPRVKNRSLWDLQIIENMSCWMGKPMGFWAWWLINVLQQKTDDLGQLRCWDNTMATSKRWKQYEQVAFPFSLNHTFSRLDECLEASGRGLAVWLASLTSAAAEARFGLAREEKGGTQQTGRRCAWMTVQGTTSEPFNCDWGRHNWHMGWSNPKKIYCCR